MESRTPHRASRTCFAFRLAVVAGMAASLPAYASSLATLIAPANGATNVAPTAPFSWTAVAGAQAYYVYVGSTVGLKDVFDSHALSPTVTTLTVTGLHPLTSYYVRLWTQSAPGWASVDTSFSTGVGPAQFTYPLNNQKQVDWFTPFTWSAVAQAQSYRLDIGSAPGGADVFSTGPISLTSALVSGLAAQTQYYARLTSVIAGQPMSVDTVFTTGTGLAHLAYPVNGATNVNPGAIFSWNAVPGAQSYILYVGTMPGAANIFKSVSSLNTSILVPNLATGTLYYARLWTQVANSWPYVDTTFTTSAGAILTYPVNGATNVDPFQPFSWNGVAGATSYTLNVGTTLGGSDTFTSGPITTTGVSVAGLLPNQLYFARLLTQTGGGPASTDASFTTGYGMAHLLVPSNGATNVDPGAAFVWNAVSTAQAYTLYLGTSLGASNVFQSGETLNTSLTVTKLTAQTPYFARLWTKLSGRWTYLDSTFTTGIGIAHLMSPANGSTNVDPYGSFTWTSVSNAVSYQLIVGSTLGASDIWMSPNVTATNLTVPNLLQNTTYYARLTTVGPSGSSFADTTFTTGIGMAHLISPQFGATGADPYAPFTWNAVPGARYYYLYVGSSPGASDVFNTGQIPPTVTSKIITGLFGGRTYYLKLWTNVNGVWVSNSGTIVTAVQPVMDPAQLLNTVLSTTAAVRGMTVGVTSTPVPGTPLAQSVAEDGQVTAFCSQFARTLAQQLTGLRITARVRNMTFDGTSLEAHTTAEYWDTGSNAWVIADATFGFLFWNSSLGQGLDMTALSSLVSSASWPAIATYLDYAIPSQAPNARIYGTNYYMDPILLYLNPVPLGATGPVFPLAYDPAPFVTNHSTRDIGTAGNWIFMLPGPSQQVTVVDRGKGTLTFTSAQSNYTSSVNLNTGWTIPSPPAGLQTVTSNRYLF